MSHLHSRFSILLLFYSPFILVEQYSEVIDMETRTEDSTDQKETDLTHREAKLVLERLNPDIGAEKISGQNQAAVDHYLPVMRGAGRAEGYDYLCKECSEAGMADLINLRTDCKEAIEVFAQMLPLNSIDLLDFREFWPGAKAGTLRQLVAIEHIWGRPGYHENDSEHSLSKSCDCKMCSQVFRTCCDVSRTNGGSQGAILSDLIDLFVEAGWSPNQLFALQKDRVKEIADESVVTSEHKELMAYINRLQASCV